ncbi:shikimate kinase [Maribacter sp. MJ134]|uniref:shikimate kinase n=1 Tax=unclassified Maribacter TaxID=2615042 RepID=UPI000C15C1C9|nr:MULTISPECIES: shikimate kinase [unclassified Maribacter]AZQ58631.1 shikimate kinase [Maribacter sp. MJ134]PIB27749.1 shikimate kinase [Maribacter sp. 4U21]
MKIVLVGYMGSGKTTIGRLLSKQLKIKFLDLDDNIEKGESRSIANIFKEKGEIYFRKKESEYLNQILETKDPFILSTGGGTPCYGSNMTNILKATENVFYVKVSIPELVRRLSNEKASRPLISNFTEEELPEFIGKHLFERSYYYNMANYKITTDDKTPEETIQEIINCLV